MEAVPGPAPGTPGGKPAELRTAASRGSFSFGALSPKLRDETETDLDVLLAKYAKPICQMLAHELLTPLVDPAEHDEVFMLRHLMSSKGHVLRASQTAAECIRWRRDNAALLARADELHRIVKATIPVGMLPHASTLHQPIQVVMPFQADLDRFVKASLDWHFETGVANREVAFRLCDRISREKRKLVKMVLLLDLSGLTFTFAYSQYRLSSVQGKLSKVSSNVYPQLVSTVVIVNAPSFMSTLFRMASGVLSKKVLDKMTVARSFEQACAAANLPYEHLPSFLGGGFDWDADWIPARLRDAGRVTMAARAEAHADARAAEAGARGGGGGEGAAASAEHGALAEGGKPPSDAHAPAAASASAATARAEMTSAAAAAERGKTAAGASRARAMAPRPLAWLALLGLMAALLSALSPLASLPHLGALSPDPPPPREPPCECWRCLPAAARRRIRGDAPPAPPAAPKRAATWWWKVGTPSPVVVEREPLSFGASIIAARKLSGCSWFQRC